MKLEIHLVLVALVAFTGSSQTKGQSHAGTTASPDLTEDPGNQVPVWTHNPGGGDKPSTQTKNEDAVSSATTATSQHTNTNVPIVMTSITATLSSSAASATAASAASAAAGDLSSTPAAHSTTPPHDISTTESSELPTTDPTTTTTTVSLSSQLTHTVQDTSSTAHSSTTRLQSESATTTAAQITDLRPPTSAPAPAGPTHQEVPSELNVGDKELKKPTYHSSSPLDPLLAGLLSVFIVTTAIVFVILFLKLRQRTNHPEFHRLQDLPMDDLMEDTPLSRYTY